MKDLTHISKPQETVLSLSPSKGLKELIMKAYSISRLELEYKVLLQPQGVGEWKNGNTQRQKRGDKKCKMVNFSFFNSFYSQDETHLSQFKECCFLFLGVKVDIFLTELLKATEQYNNQINPMCIKISKSKLYFISLKEFSDG